MKDTPIIDNQSMSSSFIFDFIYSDDNNNDQLLCGIIENLWASQDSCSQDIFKNSNNRNHINKTEDIFELQAYLYEIDMNLEYFRNDYQEFNDYDVDINIDKLLSFKFSQDACNMLLYETEISYKLRFATNKLQLSEIFAHVEDIPEFVPISYNQTDQLSESDLLFEDQLQQQLMYDDDITQIGSYDEFLNDDLCVMTNSDGTDIFENVYNNYPGDAEEDEENEEEIGVSTTSSDENSSRSDKKITKKNQKFLSAYYLRKKLALNLDIDNSSSSSSASSLSNIPNAVLNGSKSFVPRLIKSNKDAFRKPCVYMLNEGRCMRSDCRFAHDLQNIMCKYWLEGECLKGESCEFLHDFITSSLSNKNETKDESGSTTTLTTRSSKRRQKLKDFSLNNQDFPELSASITSNKSNKTPNTGTSIDSKYDADSNTENDVMESKLIEDQSKVVNNTKKSRRFKDKVLYSLTLPAFQLKNRKKNIN